MLALDALNGIYTDAAADLSNIEREYREAKELFPATFVAMINFPHHYGAVDRPDPPRESLLTTYNSARYPFRDNATLQAIIHGLQTYGAIPAQWKDFE